MLRVIQEARPTWIVGENVAGIIGLALDKVCSDLEACGYEVEPIIIPACGVDAPHRRDRVWIMGNAKFNGHSASQKRSGLLHKSEEQTREIEKWESSGASCSPQNVADSKCDAEGSAYRQDEREGQRGRQNQNIIERNEVGSNLADGGKDVAYANSGRICGVRWLAEPGLGRLANGIPNRVAKLKGLGNAIVPQVAYEILKAIRSI
jgi:DNA (cytosine-5)-methyltransferase 1